MLERDFYTEVLNQVWVSDLTYIWTDRGWVYLCVIIDLFARKVVGWSLRGDMRDDIVLEALNHAFESRGPKVDYSGLTFHSDRGSQYGRKAVIGVLEARGITRSMSRRGDCWDSGVAESFFASLKKQLVFQSRYADEEEAAADIGECIELFYSNVRLHSYNDYLSPAAMERLA